MSTAAPGTMSLSDVRARAAAALAPVDADDPDVLFNYPDAIHPPVLIVGYADPWLDPITVGGLLWDCRIQVVAVAGRIEPGPGVETLEHLITHTLQRLDADANTWPLETGVSPRQWKEGGVTYLGAQLTYRVKVTL